MEATYTLPSTLTLIHVFGIMTGHYSVLVLDNWDIHTVKQVAEKNDSSMSRDQNWVSSMRQTHGTVLEVSSTEWGLFLYFPKEGSPGIILIYFEGVLCVD